jgi:hypothetical protein
MASGDSRLFAGSRDSDMDGDKEGNDHLSLFRFIHSLLQMTSNVFILFLTF